MLEESLVFAFMSWDACSGSQGLLRYCTLGTGPGYKETQGKYVVRPCEETDPSQSLTPPGISAKVPDVSEEAIRSSNNLAELSLNFNLLRDSKNSPAESSQPAELLF